MKRTEDVFKITRARRSLYNFLARIYGKEPDPNFLRKMREPAFSQVFSELGIEFEKDFLERPEIELLDAMSVEYTRLFIGPGRHISPHESVHRGSVGLLWGDATVKVKAFIEAAGLKYRSDFKGIPDHISVELEFMYRLLKAEEEAREKRNLSKLKKILGLQKRFANEHIFRWVPRLMDKIAKETKLDFYRKIAILTKEFILFETENMPR